STTALHKLGLAATSPSPSPGLGLFYFHCRGLRDGHEKLGIEHALHDMAPGDPAAPRLCARRRSDRRPVGSRAGESNAAGRAGIRVEHPESAGGASGQRTAAEAAGGSGESDYVALFRLEQLL